MMKKNLLLVRYTFILFSVSGLCATGYLIYEVTHPRKNWAIQITGNLSYSQKKEIEDTINYFVKLNKNRVDESSLAEILKLNPRVSEVIDIDISSQKKITIKLKLKKTGYIYHNPSNHQFEEVSSQGEVLETKMNNFHEIDDRIPILCLTDRLASDENPAYSDDENFYGKMRRDIISIFEKTELDYGFVWQYISEICFARSPYLYTIYSSHIRSRIQTNDKFDVGLIRRLWALFYYLEKKSKEESVDVKLNRYNARIKKNNFF